MEERQVSCRKCGNQWWPRTERPKKCPSCQSLKWDGAVEGGERAPEPVSDKNVSLVSSLIKSFEVVNLAAKTWYGNKTQRAACERLLEAQDFERLLRVIAFLPRTNAMPYFPLITTPLQLEAKWTALEAAFIRAKGSSQSKGRGVA